ncbi:NfeD family protein [Lysinibacter cavernae]|uniref:Membrane-bound ClpP family serine protease n=1 Tax=Lysinibacter cavernae TaxID=1640652 RepID=A0A7X5TU30_9MICO|nr:NfeD family protein [Lysinibacter cavernae]NIH54144.1 membrane-bound ClpP family serine protease [Lysinibacter cavernae]
MSDWITSIFDGTLVAGGVFLIIGCVGALLLVISLLLGGIFDAFEIGDGPLSLTTLSAFAAIFGFASFAAIGAGTSPVVGAVIGLASGCVGGGLAWWMTRVFRTAESNSSTSTATIIGQQAFVILPLPGEGGMGEISFMRHGERVTMAARSAQPVLAGAEVRIVAVISDTSVMVEPARSGDRS